MIIQLKRVCHDTVHVQGTDVIGIVFRMTYLTFGVTGLMNPFGEAFRMHVSGASFAKTWMNEWSLFL